MIIAVASLLAACETLDTKDERNFEIDGILSSQYPVNKKLEIANNEYEKGALFEAEKNYLNILSDHPGISDAWFKLGNIYYRSGRYKAAVNAFESVLKLDNLHDKAWYNLSLARVSQAVEAIDTSLGVLEKDSEAYIRGLLLKKNLLNRISAVENEEIRANNLKANQRYQIEEQSRQKSSIDVTTKLDKRASGIEDPIVRQSPTVIVPESLRSSAQEIEEQTRNQKSNLTKEISAATGNTKSEISSDQKKINSSGKELIGESEINSERVNSIAQQGLIISDQSDLNSLTPEIGEQTKSLNQKDQQKYEKTVDVKNTQTIILESETDVDLPEKNFGNGDIEVDENDTSNAVQNLATPDEFDLESAVIEMLEKKEPLNQPSNLIAKNIKPTDNIDSIRADEKSKVAPNKESLTHITHIGDAVDVLSERSSQTAEPKWIVEPFTQELKDSLLNKEGE